MSSKGETVSESKMGLGQGWLSLGRKTRSASSSGAQPAASPPSSSHISSSAPPRVRISKAEMLERYEPGAGLPAGLPPIMGAHSGVTFAEELVPVNISPDEELIDLMSSAASSARNLPRGSPRSTASLSRHRLTVPSSPPASSSNARVRLGVNGPERNEIINGKPLNHSNAQKNPPSSSTSNSYANISSSNSQSAAAFGSAVSANPGTDNSNLFDPAASGAKRSTQSSSNRDFWANSAMPPSLDRTGVSAPGERRPLALKPRSVQSIHSDATGSGLNGASGELQSRPSQQGSSSYWTRSVSRVGADGNSNWRGGSGSTGGGIAAGDSANPSSNSITGASSTTKIGSGSLSTSNLHSARPGFGREAREGREGRDPYSRNKEALKPTNTRDLSALAKGSTRDNSGGTSASFSNREREYRTAGAAAVTETKPQQKPADILADNRNLWYYKDPKGSVQGPFSASKMMHWLKEGYYDDCLEISKSSDSGFRPLAIVFGLRKEEETDTAPPGFVTGSTVPALSSSPPSTPSALVDRALELEKKPEVSERHPEERKLTVKEMEEEVEKQRLEARRKNHQKMDEKSAGNGNAVGSVFDPPFMSDTTRRGMFQEDEIEKPKSLAKIPLAAYPMNNQLENVKAADEVTYGSNQSDSQKRDSDIGPARAESRFASILGGVKPDAIKVLDDEKAGKQNHTSSLDDVAIPPFSKPDLVKEDPLAALGQASLDPLLKDKQNQALEANGVPPVHGDSTNPQSVWAASSSKPHFRGQHVSSDISSAPLPLSEHDLMALDPAIARASFNRKPNETPASTAPWNDSSTSPKTSGNGDRGHGVNQLRPLNTGSYAPNSQAQAIAQAQAQHRAAMAVQAQAAQAQAEAVRAAQVQALQAQAQAQARARAHAAQVQAQARAQAQASASNHDPFIAFRHQIAQLQTGWDLHCRGQLEASGNLQRARQALNNAPARSLEHQQALAACTNLEAVVQEHTFSMDRIKAAAQSTHNQMLRLQQQQQQQILQRQQQQVPVHTAPALEIQHAQRAHVAQKPTTPIQHEHSTNDAEIDQITTSVSAVDLEAQTEPSAKRGHSSPNIAPPAVDPIQDLSNIESPAQEPTKTAPETSSVPKASVVHSPTQNKSNELVWETVERKTRVAGEGVSPVAQRAVEAHDEQPPVLPTTNIGVAVRGPVDSHVIVVSADKDPRKLEIAAERELENESYQRKVSSIPAPWLKSGQSGQQNGPSLREIQRQEELRSKAEMEAHNMRQVQIEQAARFNSSRNAAASATPWGGAAGKQPSLSLREQMRLEEQKQRNAARLNVIGANAVANRASRAAVAQPNARPAWSSLVANKKPAVQSRPAVAAVVGKRMDDENNGAMSNNKTSWETVGGPVRRNVSAGTVGTTGTTRQNAIPRVAPVTRSTTNVAPRATRAVQAAGLQSTSSAAGTKKNTEATNVQGRVSTEMAMWCNQQLRGITGSENDSTFAEYLAGLKTEAEIRDTVVQNLGLSDKTRAFADEFIRRLAFEKSGDSQEQGFGTNGGGRKRGRRQRAAKVDPSLVLGFTSTSSSSRIMQGTIEKPTME